MFHPAGTLVHICEPCVGRCWDHPRDTDVIHPFNFFVSSTCQSSSGTTYLISLTCVSKVVLHRPFFQPNRPLLTHPTVCWGTAAHTLRWSLMPGTAPYHLHSRAQCCLYRTFTISVQYIISCFVLCKYNSIGIAKFTPPSLPLKTRPLLQVWRPTTRPRRP